MRLVPLSSLLLTIAQGLPTQRYEVAEGEGGERHRLIQIRQLDSLFVSNALPEVFLKGDKLERYLLPREALLVATRTWPMKASVVTEDVAGAIAGQNIAVLTLKPDANPVFLAGLLRSGFMQDRLGIRASASGQPMISLKQLQEVEIPLPPLEQQHALAELFLEREEADHLAQESTLQRHRVVEAALSHYLKT